MKLLEQLSDNIGRGSRRGIYEESDLEDGKRFCTWCGKLIRVGQEVIKSWGPKRDTYKHTGCGPKE